MEERESRLVLEYDMNNDYEKAVLYMQNRILRDEKNINNWIEYARLALRNKDISRAEECLNEIQAINGGTNLEFLNIQAALLIQRERYIEASEILNGILEKDVTNLIANLLYSFLYNITD